MSAIAGIISGISDAQADHSVDQMLLSLIREPDLVSGALTQKSVGVRVGWSCKKGSFSDCLPIWNETKDICLFFSGECFEGESQIKQLKAQGHAIEGHNASYLVHLYEEVGTRFVQSLNGVFSGLLIDLARKKVILFNDRFGLNRMYYHETPNSFYFASEAKALLKVLPSARQIEMQGLGELFTLGCVIQNRTLFKGISVLPPGSCWTFSPHEAVSKEAYFVKDTWESQEPLPPAEYYEKLKDTFARILPKYLKAGEATAMSLTGGLDSRIIMAWAQCEPSKLPCYSHRGMFNECADAKIARRVAKICRQPHRNIIVDENFLKQFPALASQAINITDGTMDVSGAVGLYVNGIARREIAKVRMTGNYGSEILRSNIAFKPRSLNESLFDNEFIPYFKKAAACYSAEKSGNLLSFIAFKQVPWHHHARFALEQSQLTIRSPYLDNELVALAFRAPLELRINQGFAARLIADGNRALASFATDRGPLGRTGIFGRLREQYQELTFKAEYAYDYGMPHWLARLDRILTPLHMEKLFLGRHKYYHFRTWYRHQLAPYVKEVLLDTRTLSRSYLRGRCVEKIVNAHVSGRNNYTSEIHMMLTGELIQRNLVAQG